MARVGQPINIIIIIIEEFWICKILTFYYQFGHNKWNGKIRLNGNIEISYKIPQAWKFYTVPFLRMKKEGQLRPVVAASKALQVAAKG